MESGGVRDEEIIQLIIERKVFPCYFGSALKMSGVEEFQKGLEIYTAEEKLSGRVWGEGI